MKDRTRILRQLHDDGGDGFFLYITHHDEGAGDVYRSETTYQDLIVWGTINNVKEGTADWLRNKKQHQCSDKCSEWQPISN
jgi:hypothetical protein